MVFGAVWRRRWPRRRRTRRPRQHRQRSGRVTFGVVSFLQYAAELHEQRRLQRVRRHARLPQHPGAALGPRARPLHARRAADHRRQPRPQPGAAPRIRVARRRRGRDNRDGHVRPARDALAHLRGVDQPLPRARAVLRGAPGPDSRTDRPRREHQVHKRPNFEVHVGVYNGEGYGRAEIDKYKSVEGRGTFGPFDEDSEPSQREHLGVLPVRLVREGPSAQRRRS